eukprot:CAMPEP_0171828514 /NCGR_PEP_ID=MMETSP0992-20121227/7213_1 /TAXON_ID=483369 /ORGANISM="non described non described, Strain CCMP2098" /LENGTH=32 /DNA_ID= /DNA_START= /DNA_END= /DNA_ORIENTATION=
MFHTRTVPSEDPLATSGAVSIPPPPPAPPKRR